MPEIDKNYLAGLYLDEITLDVMPQEYIDAALEVKLRYDACAPRAGYVCVQDRRVKGGFYYRKAPQGQGVNALPPSKLERALARSQEQSRPRSEMGFLSKAAIGAGLAVGGLALTGAVVNAGRSSEPYQEPVRQKPDPAKTHFNATTIGVAGVAASSVGATVIGLSKKTESQKVEETIKPEESAKTEAPKTPEEVQKKEGADAAGYNIAAIKEMTSSPISSSAIAYENALAIKYSKEGGLAQGREKASLYAPEGDENFVRLSDVQYSAEKKEPTKASRAKTSADLQKTHDKLKEYGLEDSIEFRKARSKARGKEGAELNTASANPYSITRDGVTESVGEMRFTRSPKEIQKAIAEKLKEQATRSQPPEKSAKPPKPEPESKAPDPVKPPSEGSAKPASNPAAALNVKMSLLADPEGFVTYSALKGDASLKAKLGDRSLVSLLDEGVEEGRIQVKPVGKNIAYRDLSATSFETLVEEAKGLNNVKNLKTDKRVERLQAALEYKRDPSRATTPKEQAGVAELDAAIAGIKEVKPEQRVSKDKPPAVDKEKKSQRGLGADKPASLEDAEKLGLVPKDTPAPSTSAISDLDAATATANLEAEREKTKKRLSRAETGVPTRDRETYISPKKQFEADVKTLKTQLEEEEVSPDKLNKRVEELRQQKTAQDALKVDTTLSRLEEDYQLEIGAKEDEISRARDKASAKVKRGELAQIISNKNKAVEARTLEVYRSLGIPDLVEDTPKVAPKKESPAPPPTTPPVTPAPKPTSEANAAAVSKLSKKEASVNEEENGSSTPITPDALSNPPEPSVAPTPTTSQASTPASKPATEKKPRSPRNKPVNTVASTASPTEVNPPVPPIASTQDLKKSLEQKAKAIADDFNGLNISWEEANKRMRAIEKSQEGKAYLMTDPTYKALSAKVSESEVGSQERKEAAKQLKDRAAQLFSRASVKPPTEAPSSGEANSALSDTQKRNKLASLASKKEAEIKAIRVRYGKGGIPRGSSDAATVDRMNFELGEMKKSLDKWDEKIKAAEVKTIPQTANDAIAPSESYLQAYYEIRDKYRRAS